MRSSFTAMAMAFAFVTMTVLPAKALTLTEKPVGGDEIVATPPEQLDSQMGLLPNTLQVGPETNTQGVFPSENRPQAGIAGPTMSASPGGTMGASPPVTRPQSSPVAVFPSRNQPALQTSPAAVAPQRN